MKKIRSIEALPVDSTKLCCNFVNTVYSWNGDDNYDFLSDYNAFIEWCIKLEAGKRLRLKELVQRAKNEPASAAEVMAKVRHIRDIIHLLLAAIARDNQKEVVSLLQAVNPFLADALSRINLEFENDAFVVAYREPEHLVSPLWLILKSLYDLLTIQDGTRIKECPGCGWVFFDETKNGKRRWCNPLNCGTRDKMNRYNKRLKNERGGT